MLKCMKWYWKGENMAFFNDGSESAADAQNSALQTDALDDFSVGFRYINDLSAYRSSDRYFELLVVAEGNVTCIKNSTRIIAAHHSVVFSFPGEGWQVVPEDDSSVLCYNVLVSPCLLTEFCNLVSHKAMDLLFSGEGHKIFRMQFRDYEYFVHNAELAISSDGIQATALTKRIAYNLISQLILSIEQTTAYPLWFERFLNEIHSPDNFLSPMSEIYKLAPYSQPMLNSYFNRFMGETLVSYITKMKLKYACNLLRFSELSVVDVAAKTRYSSLSHFNHIFKKHVGMTPSEYRINNYSVEYTEEAAE